MENANKVKTPAMTIGLGANVGGSEHRNEEWSYASVVGMLLYLASNNWPDIAFAVHQVAQFLSRPMQCHEDVVKRIVRYLIGTKDEGLYFGSKTDFWLEAYADDDFAGLWGIEEPQHPTSTKSHSGYLIRLGGCPIIWRSKLQTLIAVSTMEAEYISLSMCMKELILLRQTFINLSNFFEVDVKVAKAKWYLRITTQQLVGECAKNDSKVKAHCVTLSFLS